MTLLAAVRDCAEQRQLRGASPYWDNGAATDAGAVTWGSGTAGFSGVVSASQQPRRFHGE